MITTAPRDRGVTVYLTSFFLTNVGVGGFTLATGLALYEDTGSPTTFALLVTAEYALGVVGQLVGGSLLDRRNILAIALVSNGLRGTAIVVGGLAFWLLDAQTFLIAVFLLSAFIRPLFRAASLVLVRHVSAADKLPRVNSLRFGLLQAAQLTGLAVVGLLYGFLPAGVVVVVVAGFMLTGTATLAPLARVPSKVAGGSAGSTAGQGPLSLQENWAQLFRSLREVPGLSIHLVLGALPVVLVSLTTVLVAPVNDALDGGSFGIVLLDGGASVGALLTILAVRRWNLSSPREVATASGLGVVGLAILYWSPAIAVAAVAFLLLGVSAALGATTLDTLLQLRGAAAILGRLAVTQEFVASATAILLVPLSGVLLSALGFHRAALAYAAIVAAYLVLRLAASALLGDRLFRQEIQPRERARIDLDALETA